MGDSLPFSQAQSDEVKEQDRILPIANIGRIMKKMLPANAKVAKEGKECMQECVSEFISFITSEASERCLQDKRKTVNGDDIIWALNTLGFDNYVEPLRIYLAKYRDQMKNCKLPEKRKREATDDFDDENEFDRADFSFSSSPTKTCYIDTNDSRENSASALSDNQHTK